MLHVADIAPFVLRKWSPCLARSLELGCYCLFLPNVMRDEVPQLLRSQCHIEVADMKNMEAARQAGYGGVLMKVSGSPLLSRVNQHSPFDAVQRRCLEDVNEAQRLFGFSEIFVLIEGSITHEFEKYIYPEPVAELTHALQSAGCHGVIWEEQSPDINVRLLENLIKTSLAVGVEMSNVWLKLQDSGAFTDSVVASAGTMGGLKYICSSYSLLGNQICSPSQPISGKFQQMSRAATLTQCRRSRPYLTCQRLLEIVCRAQANSCPEELLEATEKYRKLELKYYENES